MKYNITNFRRHDDKQCIVFRCWRETEYGMVLCPKHLGSPSYHSSWLRRFAQWLADVFVNR